MMDAVEFLREYARMCAKSSCGGCAIRKANTEAHEVTCVGFLKKHPTTAVAVVKQWAKTHPVQTRQSEFLKQWPNAVTDNDGVISIAPCRLGEVNSSECNDAGRCPDCRKAFWIAEVEE